MKKNIFYIAALSTILPFNTYATIRTYDGCDGKCTFTYDSDNLTLDVTPKENAEGEILMHELDTRGRNLAVKTMTVHEGINGARTDKWGYIAMYVNATPDSVIELPSTFHTQGATLFNSPFNTVDLSAVQNETQDVNISISGTGLQHLVMGSDSDVRVSFGTAYNERYHSSSVEIDCKGADKSVCLDKLTNVKTDAEGNKYLTLNGENVPVTVEYYKGYDDKGNITEEWGPNGQTTYTYKYDGGGNLVGCVDSHGNRLYGKKIYTVEEAEAATAKGDKFHVSLTYK